MRMRSSAPIGFEMTTVTEVDECAQNWEAGLEVPSRALTHENATESSLMNASHMADCGEEIQTSSHRKLLSSQLAWLALQLHVLEHHQVGKAAYTEAIPLLKGV